MNRDELIARRELTRLLAADVSVVDTNQGTSVVDLAATRDGKPVAIVEVTSLVLGDQRALESKLDDLTRPAPRLARSWTFWLAPTFPHEMVSHGEMEQVAKQFEAAGVFSDHDLDWGPLRDEVEPRLLALIDGGHMEFTAGAPSDDPKLHLVPRMSRGGGLPGAEALIPWWRSQFLEEPTSSLARRMAKVREAKAPEGCERQLWVSVDMDFVDIGVANLLCFETAVPDEQVDLPVGIDRVWLYSGWRRGGIVEVSDTGWSRHELAEE